MTNHVRAVDDVSFTIKRGETLGLVGESGSGKTTIGRSILRAIDPTGGEVWFRQNGSQVDLAQLSGSELRSYRRYLQMIFQDSLSALNPRRRAEGARGPPRRAGWSPGGSR